MKPLTLEETRLKEQMKERCLAKGQYIDENAKAKFDMLCHLEDFEVQYWELQQENKELKEENEFLKSEIEEAKRIIQKYLEYIDERDERIDKAIEYLESNNETLYTYEPDYDYEENMVDNYDISNYREDLLKILKEVGK